MKKIRYTVLLGMLMMGMTTITAWSQSVTDITATSATFHYGTGTARVAWVVKESSALAPDGLTVSTEAGDADQNRDQDPVNDQTMLIEDLTPGTSYILYYIVGDLNVLMMSFATTLLTITPSLLFVGVTEAAASTMITHQGLGVLHYGLSPPSASEPTTVVDMQALVSYGMITGAAREELIEFSSLESATEYKLYVVASNDDGSMLWSDVTGSVTFTTLLPNNIESRIAAIEAQVTVLEAGTPHTHADFTTLEAGTPHTHADFTTLEAGTPHTHADFTTLEAGTPHTHTDFTTLEAGTPHTHANKMALDEHSHTDLAMQMHAHTEVPTHTHEGDDDGEDGDGGGNGEGGVTGLPSGNSRLAFVPNPTHDTFTLRGLDSYARIEIYDAGGRLVHMQTRGLSIALTGYPAGTYIARVHTKSGVFTRQLVKS